MAKDAADWFPEHNRCWFAGRVLAVKLEYGLSVDPQEAAALEAVLKACSIGMYYGPTDRRLRRQPNDHHCRLLRDDTLAGVDSLLVDAVDIVSHPGADGCQWGHYC